MKIFALVLVLLVMLFGLEHYVRAQKRAAEHFCSLQPAYCECKVIMGGGQIPNFYVTYKQGGRWVTKIDF